MWHCLNLYLDKYLRNRKDVPCFYWVTETWVEFWENKKRCGIKHKSISECFQCFFKFSQTSMIVYTFHNSIETQGTFFYYFEKILQWKKKLVYFDLQDLNFLACAMNMSMACAIPLFLSSYRNTTLNQWVHIFPLDYFLNNYGESSIEWTPQLTGCPLLRGLLSLGLVLKLLTTPTCKVLKLASYIYLSL